MPSPTLELCEGEICLSQVWGFQLEKKHGEQIGMYMVRVLQYFGFPRMRGIRNLVCVPNPFRSLNLLCLDHHAISFLLFLFLHFQMYDSLLVKLTCSTLPCFVWLHLQTKDLRGSEMH